MAPGTGLPLALDEQFPSLSSPGCLALQPQNTLFGRYHQPHFTDAGNVDPRGGGAQAWLHVESTEANAQAESQAMK